MSKIEKPSAVDAFEEILEETDAVMVARGDLGVELPIETLPPIQKRLVRQCRHSGKLSTRRSLGTFRIFLHSLHYSLSLL